MCFNWNIPQLPLPQRPPWWLVFDADDEDIEVWPTLLNIVYVFCVDSVVIVSRQSATRYWPFTLNRSGS